jgi:uncharacterized membrane protein
VDLWDVLVIVGLVLTATGLWMLAPWLSVTVVGVVLLALGLFGVRASARSRETS